MLPAESQAIVSELQEQIRFDRIAFWVLMLVLVVQIARLAKLLWPRK